MVVGVFFEELECAGFDGASFQLDHFEVSADCPSEDSDAVGVCGEPLDEFVNGRVSLLVLLPRR